MNSCRYFTNVCLRDGRRWQHGFGGKLKLTVTNAVEIWNDKFVENGISEPKESAEHILAHVLGTKKIADIYKDPNTTLIAADVEKLDKLCSMRLKMMPIQYIIQEWDFRDLTLKMSRPVFIPRPETEMLVDIVLKEIDAKEVDRILEFCCGCGAISLALLQARAQLQITAFDKSEYACKLTKVNADINKTSNRLKIHQVNLHENFSLPGDQIFDLIVSNPPYVPTKDISHLQPEITMYEDLEALDGGEDGLTVIKIILKISSRFLNYGGKLFLEVDPSHPQLIKSWCEHNTSLGLMFLRSFTDFSDKERFVEIMKQK